MIQTPSGRHATAKSLLSILSFTASIPFQALYVPPTPKEGSPQTSDPVLRFVSSDRSRRKHQAWFIILVLGITAATIYSIVQMETQFILTGYLLVMLYHMNLKYRLGKFEQGKRLVYDQEFKVYEYRSGGKTIVFKNSDIERITLHINGPEIKIARVYLENRTITISSRLVNFALIPLLEENPAERVYHSFLFRIPKG